MISSTLSGALTFFTQAGQGVDPLRGNYAFHVGDDRDKVRAERELLSSQLGAPIVWMNQTHSHRVRVLRFGDNPGCQELLLDGTEPFDPRIVDQANDIDADGIILDTRQFCGGVFTERQTSQVREPTDSQHVTSSVAVLPALAVMTADCLPLLFSNETGTVVAAVHAGRVGLEKGIVLETLRTYESLGVEIGDIHMFIGPAICGQCYEVPEQMAAEAHKKLPHSRSTTAWGTPSLDLALAARTQALSCGIGSVDDSGVCTREDLMFHSYRRDAACGRQASIIHPRFGAYQ